MLSRAVLVAIKNRMNISSCQDRLAIRTEDLHPRRTTMTHRMATVLIGMLAFVLPLFGQTGPLDLATRTRYQRAVEEVFWQQRIWPTQNPTAKPALESLISPEQLQA